MNYDTRVFIPVIMEILVFKHGLYKQTGTLYAQVIICNKAGITKKCSGYLVLPEKINVGRPLYQVTPKVTSRANKAFLPQKVKRELYHHIYLIKPKAFAGNKHNY